MKNQHLKGTKRLIAAFWNSVAGFRDIWRSEEAFRLELLIFVISIPVALVVGPNAVWAALMVLSLLFVVIVEILNTAIEAVVDRIGTERHELSRIAKDLGSLAVLLSCLFPVIIWAMALYKSIASE
ncbi:diacylglycerol kinase [Aestuariivita boseongensis]|uniref:diacylglycerol kinase n=1 Tax=Aestuariivita boseongensis TaxID=1470562 RepID=UPI00068070AA|nr:diacylglycerol kinase [Aestuariivita boseongensis]